MYLFPSLSAAASRVGWPSCPFALRNRLPQPSFQIRASMAFCGLSQAERSVANPRGSSAKLWQRAASSRTDSSTRRFTEIARIHNIAHHSRFKIDPNPSSNRGIWIENGPGSRIDTLSDPNSAARNWLLRIHSHRTSTLPPAFFPRVSA